MTFGLGGNKRERLEVLANLAGKVSGLNNKVDLRHRETSQRLCTLERRVEVCREHQRRSARPVSPPPSVLLLREEMDRIYDLLKEFGYEYSTDIVGWQAMECEDEEGSDG